MNLAPTASSSGRGPSRRTSIRSCLWFGACFPFLFCTVGSFFSISGRTFTFCTRNCSTSCRAPFYSPVAVKGVDGVCNVATPRSQAGDLNCSWGMRTLQMQFSLKLRKSFLGMNEVLMRFLELYFNSPQWLIFAFSVPLTLDALHVPYCCCPKKFDWPYRRV